MKVLLVGVFSHGSTDCWKKLALERLGHRVVCAPYRDRSVRENFPIGVPFDLVFVSKGVPLSVEEFAHLATLGKHRLLWWPDPFENWDEAHTEALATGAWSLAATSSVVLSKIMEAACRFVAGKPENGMAVRTARILEGCDCDGPKPEWRPPTIEPALLHFGHLSERRASVIAQLRAAGVTVNHLERPLFGSALQKQVLRHAAVLGINSSPDLYSNRVQTVLAMGGVIVQEEASGLVEDFPFLTNECCSWIDTEELLRHTSAAIDAARKFQGVSHDYARRCFDRYRWERVMERAIEFACVGAA